MQIGAHSDFLKPASGRGDAPAGARAASQTGRAERFASLLDAGERPAALDSETAAGPDRIAGDAAATGTAEAGTEATLPAQRGVPEREVGSSQPTEPGRPEAPHLAAAQEALQRLSQRGAERGGASASAPVPPAMPGSARVRGNQAAVEAGGDVRGEITRHGAPASSDERFTPQIGTGSPAPASRVAGVAPQRNGETLAGAAAAGRGVTSPGAGQGPAAGARATEEVEAARMSAAPLAETARSRGANGPRPARAAALPAYAGIPEGAQVRPEAPHGSHSSKLGHPDHPTPIHADARHEEAPELVRASADTRMTRGDVANDRARQADGPAPGLPTARNAASLTSAPASPDAPTSMAGGSPLVRSDGADPAVSSNVGPGGDAPPAGRPPAAKAPSNGREGAPDPAGPMPLRASAGSIAAPDGSRQPGPPEASVAGRTRAGGPTLGPLMSEAQGDAPNGATDTRDGRPGATADGLGRTDPTRPPPERSAAGASAYVAQGGAGQPLPAAGREGAGGAGASGGGAGPSAASLGTAGSSVPPNAALHGGAPVIAATAPGHEATAAPPRALRDSAEGRNMTADAAPRHTGGSAPSAARMFAPGVSPAPAGGAAAPSANATAQAFALPSGSVALPREALHGEASAETGAAEIPAAERSAPSGPGATSATRPGGPSAPAPALAQQLSEAVRQAGIPGSVEVSLHPEELGRVRLTFTPAEAGLAVTVAAERPETLDLLRRHIDLLAADLRAQGFEDIAFEFGARGDGSGRDAAPAAAAAMAAPDEPPPGGPDRPKSLPAPPPAGGLDLRL